MLSEIEKKKTITQIVVQKKRKDRCSIFLDGEFEIGLHQDVVVKFGLKKGDVLSDEQLNEIILAEERKKAFERAIRILSYRDRSEKEMRDKLSEAKYDDAIIEFVIAELKRLNLINDKNFAQLFARTKMANKPMGKFLLKRELLQKGLSEEIIEGVIEKIYQEKDEYQIAFEIAARRKRQYKNIDEKKAKKKISDLLARRGFSWDVISHVLEHWQDLDYESKEE